MATMNRNRRLIRSIIFGVFSKASGSLVVLIGFPFAALNLTSMEYALFLKCMGISSLQTLIFGIFNSVVVKHISEAHTSQDRHTLNKILSLTAGIYVVLFGISLSIGALFVVYYNYRGDLLFPLAATAILASIQGLCMWADAYRVATRNDHISNVIQLVANLCLVFLFFVCAGYGINAVVISYFAVPALALLLNLILLHKFGNVYFKPKLDVFSFRYYTYEAVPLAINSLAEYMKVFGLGLIAANFLPDSDYAIFTTLILFAVRLINPLSLVTRPLMPAVIDAIANADFNWLRRMIKVIIYLFIFLLFACSAILAIYDYYQDTIRETFNHGIGVSDLLFTLLFFWAQCGSVVLLPILISIGKSKIYSVLNLLMILMLSAISIYLQVEFQYNWFIQCVAFSTFLTSGFAAFIVYRNIYPASKNNILGR